jgi:hypothetical protein
MSLTLAQLDVKYAFSIFKVLIKLQLVQTLDEEIANMAFSTAQYDLLPENWDD